MHAEQVRTSAYRINDDVSTDVVRVARGPLRSHPNRPGDTEGCTAVPGGGQHRGGF